MLELNLSEYDARIICDDKETIDYFDELIAIVPDAKASVNWLLGPVRSYLKEHDITIKQLPLLPSSLAGLIQLVQSGQISFSVASSRIFPLMLNDSSKDALGLANELNLFQNSDSSTIETWVDEVLARMPDKVQEFKKGKKGLIGLFMGEVKKVSHGKADPKVATQLLNQKLTR